MRDDPPRSLSGRLRAEWRRLWKATRTLDAAAVFVLVACIVLVVIHEEVSGRRFYFEHVRGALPEEWRDLGRWGWRFFTQGITGFVLPVAALLLIFRRRPSEIGLGLGDWKLAGTLALVYLPLVAIGTFVLSASPEFNQKYPHFQPAAADWRVFAVYHTLYLFYWVGWEYLWRGFVLFGTARALGYYAIFVQTIPFALMHLAKPMPEMLLSIVGGIALGALCWRCRSFWIAVPIHWAQMFLLDLFCSLRARTGAEGVGLDALWKMLGG
jgi:hypothetical protein